MKRRALDLLISLLILLWIAPLIWLAVTSLKVERDVMTSAPALFPSPPTIENYRWILSSSHVYDWLRNSLIVSVVATILTVAVDAPIAYAFARIPFPGKQILFWFVMAGMMIPFEAILVPLYLQFNAYGLTNTLTAAILPRLAVPIGIFILKQFFEGIPAALEEAAFIDGAGRFRVFLSIVMPVGSAALTTVVILAFISSWNDFLWPLIVISDTVKYTITVGIANFQGTHGTEYSLIMAGALIASIPQFVFYALFRKKIVAGIAMTGIKG